MPSSTRAVATVLVAAALFGTAGTARELGPDSATAVGVGATRIVIATAVLWIAVGRRRARGSMPGVPRPLRSNAGIITLGGLGVAVYTPLFFEAVERTGVAVGTIVAVGSGPFFAGVMEWVWRGVRPSRWWTLGTVVTVAGGALLVVAQDAGNSGSDPIDGVGLVLAVVAGAGYACYSVTSKVVIERGVDPTLTLAATFALGSAGIVVLAAREPFGWITSPEGMSMAVALGVPATGLAYLLFGFGLRRLSSATVVTLVLAEPLTATLLAVAVLGESIAPAAWLGFATLALGLLIVGRTAEASSGYAVPGTA